MKSSFLQNAIASFSTYFVKTYRITILLLLAIIAIGYVTYTQFLKREGLPPIEIPIAILQTSYLANDSAEVDLRVAGPLEKKVLEVPEVKSTLTQSYPNFSIIQIEFVSGYSSEQGVDALKDELKDTSFLPEGAELNYMTINAGAVDGESDLLFSLSGEGKTTFELQDKALFLSNKFSKLNAVKNSNATDVLIERANPFTGKTVIQKEGYSRVGLKEDGELVFREAINVGVTKKLDSGIVETSDQVREEIKRLENEGELNGYTIAYGGDMAQYTKDQIQDLESTALTSLIAVVVVLFIMINWRASIIGAIFIPTVFFATFLGLYLIGYELNTMVLFGLILVLGLFVDDAIVVVESVDRQKRLGKKGAEAVTAAIKDIGIADISGTLTTLLVFIPMALISGVLGDFIQYIPVTVIIALVASLIIALTTIAFLSSFLIPNYKKVERKTFLSKIGNVIFNELGDLISMASKKVGQFIGWYVCKPLWATIILIVSLGLISGGIYYSTKLKFSTFAPPKDANSMIVQMSFPDGTTVDQAEQIAIDAENILVENADDEILEVDYFASNSTQGYLFVRLTDFQDREKTAPELVEAINDDYSEIDNASMKASAYSAGPPDTTEYKFFVQVYSDDQALLERAADELTEFLTDKEVLDGEKSFDPAVDYLTTIARKDGERFIQVKTKISDTQNSGIIIELQKTVEEEFNESKLEELGLDADQGILFNQGLESELMGSFDSALFFFYIALAVMYVLLVLQYNSFSLPFLVLLAIPFSFAGVFPALFYSNNELSFFALIGVIALSGIVVNNTIMLIDFANRERLSGKNPGQAISTAMAVRFRPIVITTITTIVALVPLSLADPFWESLVYTIIFGLLASTILAVTAFPVYYCIIEKLRFWKNILGVKIKNKIN